MTESDPLLDAILREYAGSVPRIDPTAWIAPGAVVVGAVEIGPDSSIWYGSVVRGDVQRITIGARTNIQDQCVVHVTKDRYSTWIGDDVTIGHRAVIHGCRIEAGALVGIGAIVLDGAVVEAGALVAAGSLVTPGSVIPGGMLAMGIPARAVRALGEDERVLQLERTRTYVETAKRHAASSPVSRSPRGPVVE